MKQLILIFLVLVLISCNNKTQEEASITSKSKDTIENKNKKNEASLISKNTVEIDFLKNKDLLDIILLLPDKSFSSWEWKLKDRTDWYNEIKKNNFYVDTNPDFFNQKYFKPFKASFSIIDGFWSIAIYKTSENSYIVITNDVVGDGNTLFFYEVKENKIKEYLNEELMFLNFKEHLKIKNTSENCIEKFEELNDPIFEYDFSKKNKIEIKSSWYLTKENYSDCLIGNSILYNFNPKTKKFEIEKTSWKDKEKS